MHSNNRTLDTTPPMFLIYRYNNYTDEYDAYPTYVMHTNAKTYDDHDINDIIQSIDAAAYTMNDQEYSNQYALTTRMHDNIVS